MWRSSDHNWAQLPPTAPLPFPLRASGPKWKTSSRSFSINTHRQLQFSGCSTGWFVAPCHVKLGFCARTDAKSINLLQTGRDQDRSHDKTRRHTRTDMPHTQIRHTHRYSAHTDAVWTVLRQIEQHMCTGRHPEDHQRIGDPFFTFSARKKGPGAGKEKSSD